MNQHITVASIFISVFLMVSCREKAVDAEVSKSGEEVHHGEEQNPNVSTLTEEQFQSIGMQLGTIEKKQLTAALKTNGVLKVPNQNKASINSIYRGVIRSLTVQPGNYVKKGQVIATIANPEFIQAQSDYLNVTDRIKLAELELKRQQELNAGNAGALKNLQAAETALSTLVTSKNTLGQQIRLMGINPEKLSNGKLVSVLSVLSPISGVISNVKVELGRYVDVTTPIAEVVDNSQLHLDLFVFEKDLSKLRNNQTIHFTITNNPGKEYDAELFSLGSSFEGESKAVTVHARVKGDKTGLIDGMNVTAVISLNQATVPAVPSDAIVTVNGQDYIFVLADSNYVNKKSENAFNFERIPVAKGNTDIGYTEITLLKEIPATAKVVIKGAFFVSAKMTNSGEGGHAH